MLGYGGKSEVLVPAVVTARIGRGVRVASMLQSVAFGCIDVASGCIEVASCCRSQVSTTKFQAGGRRGRVEGGVLHVAGAKSQAV